MNKIHSPVPYILLVDDNTQNLQVLGKLLQEVHYRTEFALNGESTFEWLKNKQFDLILLDLNLPGMNGFEICKRIRSDNKMDEVPVIFLSAESERESILKGFEVGAQDYVTKPFDNRELLARVRTQLDLKSKTENLRKINEWLGKKIENWLKVSLTRPGWNETDDLNTKLMEFDKNHSFVLKDICLELKTSINEAEKLIGSNNDANIRDQCREIIGRMENSIIRLGKL